ncbi:MAG: hypothetical protein K1Y01_18350 [Vicinamibacteria bacterium]|nr:hypothetical protein [Vicinamibacteria bacterium]
MSGTHQLLIAGSPGNTAFVMSLPRSPGKSPRALGWCGDGRTAEAPPRAPSIVALRCLPQDKEPWTGYAMSWAGARYVVTTKHKGDRIGSVDYEGTPDDPWIIPHPDPDCDVEFLRLQGGLGASLVSHALPVTMPNGVEFAIGGYANAEELIWTRHAPSGRRVREQTTQPGCPQSPGRAPCGGTLDELKRQFGNSHCLVQILGKCPEGGNSGSLVMARSSDELWQAWGVYSGGACGLAAVTPLYSQQPLPDSRDLGDFLRVAGADGNPMKFPHISADFQ